jgi:hypothetical protein
VSQLAGGVHFTQQDVGIPKLAGKLNGSDFTLKLTGHQLMTHPDVNLDGNFSALDLDKLLPPLTAAPASKTSAANSFGVLLGVAYAAEPPPMALPPLKTSGRIVVGKIKHELYQAKNLDFTWNLADLTPDLAHVTGTAVLKQGEGKVTNIEKLAAVSKAVRIALFPILELQKLDQQGLLKAVHLPSLESIPFTSITGDYALKSGLMDIKTFNLVGPQLSINTTGSIGLAGTQPLDIKVVMKLAAGMLGGTLGQLTQDENGRSVLPFSVTGTIGSPQVHPELQDITRKAVQQFGGQLLNGLLKKKSNPQNSSQPASSSSSGGSQAAPDQNQNNPADDLQKALKNIFH